MSLDRKTSLNVHKNKLKSRKNKFEGTVRDSMSRTPEGYTLDNIDGDGNCQFRAIAHQLGNEGIFDDVRQEIVQELRANRGEYMNLAACASDEEYKNYVDRMMEDTGDAVTLLATTNALLWCGVEVKKDGVNIDSDLIDLEEGRLIESHGTHILAVAHTIGHHGRLSSSYSMSSLVYYNISELRAGRMTDGVKVRVIRCYRAPSSTKSDPDGTLELVLHDEIEDRIHATIDYALFKEKKMDILEGRLYKITNFMVAHDMTPTKSTTNPLKMKLYKYTTIIPFQDSDFPISLYRFRDLWEISNDIGVDNFQLLDVIGRVISYQKPTFVAKVSSRRMDFTIANTENKKLGCSLWGDYIDPVLSIFERDDSRPLIICIQFGKISRYRDEIKVATTYHISKVTINGHDNVFKTFLDGMGDQDALTYDNVLAQEINDIHALFKDKSATVRSIDKLEGIKNGETVWVDATIFEIKSKSDWYYRSCKKCFKKMPRDERNRQCFSCGELNFTDIFRYKIIVGVADSTGCASMLMWDTQCTTLIGKSAREMKMINDKTGKLMPFEIEDSLMDKRVLFEITCPAMQINSDMKQYKVERLAVDEEIFDMYAARYTPTKGSTTDCMNELKDADKETTSRLRKGKQKVESDDIGDSAIDDEEQIKLTEGVDEMNYDENLEDDVSEEGDNVTLQDLQKKNNNNKESTYSSRRKRKRVILED